MSLIVLEGNECCYKSTVAEKLSKELNIPIVKGSSFEHSQCNNEELFQKHKELASLENVILDRSIYSNRVYATLYEDYSILTDEQRKCVEDLIRQKARVYYLFADDEIIKQRIRQRGDEYVNEDRIGEINTEYAKVMMDSTLPVFSYDTGEWSSDEIVKDILNDYK